MWDWAWLKLLAFTLALIPLVYWSTRLYVLKSGYSRPVHIRVIEACVLTPDTKIVLVEILGGYYVLSVSGKAGVSVLQTITDPAAVQRLQRTPSRNGQAFDMSTEFGGVSLDQLKQKLLRIRRMGLVSEEENAVSKK